MVYVLGMEKTDSLQSNRSVQPCAKFARSRGRGKNRRPTGIPNVRHRQAFCRINSCKGASESRSFSRRNRIKEGVQRAYKGIRRKSEASGAIGGTRAQGTREARERKRRACGKGEQASEGRIRD